MPLSPPSEREHIHTRTVTCRGYRRTDGLWDIEGHLVDQKTYGFNNTWRGRVEAGMPVHEMWVRLTVDDDMVVRAIEVCTDASPYQICGDIAPNFQRVVGLRIVAGWTQAVKDRLGGVEGCTHLVELLGPVATTAFQTIFPLRAREAEEKRKAAARDGGAGDAGEGADQALRKRPPLLDSCHAFSSTGSVVKRYWPEFYRDPVRPAPEGTEG